MSTRPATPTPTAQPDRQPCEPHPSPRGQVFTLVHEFAHLMLREGGLCDLLEPDGYAGRAVERGATPLPERPSCQPAPSSTTRWSAHLSFGSGRTTYSLNYRAGGA